MKRININLYNRGGKKEYELFVFAKRFLPQAFSLLLIFVAINVFLLIMNGFYDINRKALTAKWNKVLPQWQRIVSLKNEIASLGSEVAAYRDLCSVGSEASRILSDIYSALPKNIWFRYVYFSQNAISLSGYVVKWRKGYLASVDEFIKNFEVIIETREAKYEDIIKELSKSSLLKDTTIPQRSKGACPTALRETSFPSPQFAF